MLMFIRFIMLIPMIALTKVEEWDDEMAVWRTSQEVIIIIIIIIIIITIIIAILIMMIVIMASTFQGLSLPQGFQF